jgi:hypothetical protein
MGGLGNQLFQIFTVISYSIEYKHNFKFLNIKNANQCADSSTLNVSVTTSISEANKGFFQIFPNPANTLLFAPTGVLTVYDILGNEVLRLNNTNSSLPINVSAISTGIYLVKLQNNNTILSQKLIIQH